MVFYLLSASLGTQRSGPLLVKQGPFGFYHICSEE